MKISKTFYLEGAKYYQKHLEILNGVLPKKLTNKEIDILAIIMKYGNSVNKGMITLISEETGTSKGSVHNYIKSLENKGFIINNTIIPLVINKAREMSYNFTIKQIE